MVADKKLGNGYYSDDKGVYVINNGKKSYLKNIETTLDTTASTNSTAIKSNTANTNFVSYAMSKFNEMLIHLNNKFCKNRAVYTMYFKMTLTNGHVLVDSTSKSMSQNCLISFNHNMNGSGQANTFTLNLLFKPNDRSIMTIKTIENALLANCAIYDKENELKKKEQIYNNCTFQYGYADDISMRSPTYNASIMDYDCNLENGNLRYTITGYCGLYSAKEYRIFPKTEYLTEANGNPINYPLDYIRRIFEVEFSDNKLYDIEFINIPDPHKVLCASEDYKQFLQKNIFQVISDILSACMTEDQYNAVKNSKSFLPNQKQLFGYYVSDSTSSSGAYGTVYVYQLESLQGEENKDKNVESIQADAGITFDWFAPESGAYNHIVKDWHPKYEGSVLMALATTFISGKDKYYTMTDDGNLKIVSGLGAARLGVSDDTEDGSMIMSTIQEYDNWSFVTQYPYSADMTILGCPCEVPMTGKIKVIAKMGNENHHSSGVYMILGKTDKISSSGFFSEFKLFKITSGFNPDYVSNITDEDEAENERNNTTNSVGSPSSSDFLPKFPNPIWNINSDKFEQRYPNSTFNSK